MAKGEFTGTIFHRCDEAMTETLLQMQERYGTHPNAYARRLLEAACEFYRENQYFHFPVLIEPVPLGKAAEDKPDELPPPAVGGKNPKGPTRPKSGPAGAAAVLHRLKPGANAGAASA